MCTSVYFPQRWSRSSRGECDQVCCRACSRQTQYFTPNHSYKAQCLCLRSQRASLITTLKTFNRSQRVQLGAMNSRSTQGVGGDQPAAHSNVLFLLFSSPPADSGDQGTGNKHVTLPVLQWKGEKGPCMCRISSCNVCVWLWRKKKRAIIDLFVLSLVELFSFY